MVMPNGVPHFHKAGGVLKLFLGYDIVCFVDVWNVVVVGLCLWGLIP